MSQITTRSADSTITTVAPPGDSAYGKTPIPPNSHVTQIYPNPISTLNEMRLGKVDYTFTGKSGPDHCPIFEITLDINGTIFKDGDVKPVPLLSTSMKASVPPAFSQNSSSSRENKKLYDNPISTLNNMKLGLVNYTCLGKTGPDHCPIFEVVLNINGYTFTGNGPNKQSAKYDAANKALNYIFVARHSNKIEEVFEERNKNQEIEEVSVPGSSDSADTTNTLSSQPNTTVSTTAPIAYGFPIKKNIRIYENPISTLNDMGLGKIDYTFIGKSGPDHAPIFKISVDINGHIFTGEGPSRKKAKYEAAREALKHILLPIGTLEASGSKNTNEETRSLSSTSSDNASQRNPKEKRSVMRNININRKTPISVLNELRSGLKYELIEQSGPAHNPIFKISIEVDGQSYVGEGHSKKAAKHFAACEALESFTQFLSNGTTFLVDQTNSKKIDVTADQIVDKAKALKLINGKVAKGPLMLLNELYPNAEFTHTINDINPYARFKYTITIRNQSFTGTGSNKKLAKNAAAQSALSKLINYSLNNQLISVEHSNVNSEEQEKADTIGRLVNEKFSSLFVSDFTYMSRKVLAGIVMTRGSSFTDAEVICVATGTKCVSGEHKSINGTSLNDMHAEVLTRRCLMIFFYDQLQLLLDPAQAEKSIFALKPDGKGYQLKEGIEFHLYINMPPCGDARVFSPHEDYPSPSRGQLRKKIGSGEGTIPVKHVPSLETWDGSIQGDILLSMSCSDKICKWNVLGLQGALLLYFIEPIYLKTIVLGSLLKEAHLYRAICGRIESSLKELPSPFVLNKPTTLKLTSVETRQPQKAPNFSVIWMVGMERPEIINTFMGKPEEGISVIAKQNLAKRFADIYRSLSTIITINESIPTYLETKEQVHCYNVAKKSLYEAFRNAQLGIWISKPIEQDMFDMVSSAF